MNRRRLSPRLRIQFVGLLMILGMAALGLRLWWIQVAHGAEWTAQIRGSSQATVRIPSVRGEIKDHNGLTLVQNRASYEVDFYLPEMVKGYRERFGPPPLAEHRAIISGMPKDVKEPDIIRIVNDGIVTRLNDLDLARDYNASQLQRHYRNDTEVPYSYIKDIDFPTMAKFSEHDVGLPGVDIAIKPVRSYVYGALASHILGYVGAPDDTNKEEARKFTFYQGDPLVNRAGSELPPGSTFKLITSFAGLRKNLTNAKYSCGGGVSYGEHFFQCWVNEKHYTHGTIGLTEAIKVSCDSFFYQFGNAAGIQSIDTVGKMLGIGEESGLQLTGGQVGNLPGPEWMQVHHPQERWSQAQTANVSIGQGYTLASPLQLAMAYVTIANGGTCYYPRLVDKVLNQDGSPVLDEHGKVAVPQTPRMRSDLRREVTPDQIELVRKGLWRVVNEDGGTGGRGRLKNVQVEGKTGTAQATDRGHKDTVAWFACFAPFDNPKYVVAVMVQGGEHGGSVAGPIATRILERTLAMDEGNFDMTVAWLAPAHKPNPFQMIKDVNYAGGNVAGGDEENADESQNADVQMASTGGAPDVEPEADAQGKVRRAPVARAIPVEPPRRRNFFERLFGGKRPAAQPTP